MSNEPLRRWRVILWIILYGYDSVKPDFLWSLVIRHIPALKNDLERIIAEYGIFPDTVY